MKRRPAVPAAGARPVTGGHPRGLLVVLQVAARGIGRELARSDQFR